MTMLWPLPLFLLNADLSSVYGDSGHFENVAVYKPCAISSHWYMNRSAGEAVNNDTGGKYQESPETQNCIHTGQHDYSPWWEVNLGRPYPVYSITIWTREEHDQLYSHRLHGTVISVDGAECYRFDTAPTARNISITCTTGVLQGSVVRVSKNSPRWTQDDDYAINFCEFQVFSCSDDYWGGGCDRRCGNCSDGEVCDKVTGHCSSCSAGWSMPQCDRVYAPDEKQEQPTETHVWPIVGGVIGVGVVIAIVVVAAVRLLRARRDQEDGHYDNSMVDTAMERLTQVATHSHSVSQPSRVANGNPLYHL